MIVAQRKKGSLQWLSWKKLPQLQWYKKLYASNPHLFVEKNGVLHKKTAINKTSQQLNMLLNSCLRISGTTYALALVLCGGDRRSAIFQETLNSLDERDFRDKHLWLKTFEDYIKSNGVKVAIIDDGITHWIEENMSTSIKPSVLKTYFCTKPQLFEKLDNILFFLPTQNILLENMFFRCVELAGSERNLAIALSSDRLTKERHLKNFERMCFKHANNFKTYASLFSNYLKRVPTLFDEEVIYA